MHHDRGKSSHRPHATDSNRRVLKKNFISAADMKSYSTRPPSAEKRLDRFLQHDWRPICWKDFRHGCTRSTSRSCEEHTGSSGLRRSRTVCGRIAKPEPRSIRWRRSWRHWWDPPPGDRAMIASENSVKSRATQCWRRASSTPGAFVLNLRVGGASSIRSYAHSGARRAFSHRADISKEAADHAARLGARTGRIELSGEIGIGALNEETQPEPVHAEGAAQVAALIYTSGTTGTPKGVIRWSHDTPSQFSAKSPG